MNREVILFPVILSCLIILVSSTSNIDFVFSSHDAEEIALYELGEDFVSEESISTYWVGIEYLASKNNYPMQSSGKVKLQFKDVETPPPEFSFC